MWRSTKRLDRATFWMWAVPLALGHVLLGALAATSVGSSLGAIDNGIIIGLAFVLAARFRDIGWPAWIGPAVLLGTMVVVPLVAVGLALMNHAVDQMMAWFPLYGGVSSVVNLVLLIVAGSVAGKTDPSAEVGHVFE